MPFETEILPFAQWLQSAIWTFLGIALGVALFALIASYLVAAVRHGPLKAGDITYRVLVAAALDLIRISPRRIFALSRLAVQEAIRRRTFSVLIVFAVILLFAGWFLDPNSPDPAKLYISTLLTATSYLVILLALFLSAFSLPTDFKSRTIYTVVTKPVRPGEIVLGRIIGFTAIGTGILLVMAFANYVFITRALVHTHELTQADLTEVRTQGELTALEGTTGPAQDHRHTVTLGADGNGRTEVEQGHWHAVTAPSGDDEVYEVGPPQDLLVARVPMLGKVQFLDRNGQVGPGINVGAEWEYHKFVEGGTPSAAVFTFDDINPERFPDGLPLEMTIRVYRTHKGDIDQGILGQVYVRNPDKKQLRSQSFQFRAKDMKIDRLMVPSGTGETPLLDSQGNKIELFEDLINDEGKIEVVLQALEPGQYYGVGRGSVYLRAGNASFRWNFIKGYVGIWLQMILVIGIGVMFSTFLTGSVAMIATAGLILLGFVTDRVFALATSVFNEQARTVWGGGPVEALIRIVTQKNVVTELEQSLATDVVKMVDKAAMWMMQTLATVVPNFGSFNDVTYLAHGFNIPGDLLGQHLVMAAAYVLGFTIAGYFFLKTREVAR